MYWTVKVLLLCYVIIFVVGWHNIDNAFNLRKIEMITGNSDGYVDCNLHGCQTPDEIYNMSFPMVFFSFFGVVFIAFLSPDGNFIRKSKSKSGKENKQFPSPATAS